MSSGLTNLVDAKTQRGSGVNTRGQLSVAASSQPQNIVEALAGGAFLATTGAVELTSAAYSHLIYLKNNEDVQWIIPVLTGTFGATNGVGDLLMQFTINPTGGTLITAGTSFNPANLNFGSSKTLGGAFIIGSEGSTIAGGFSASPALIPEGVSQRVFPGNPLILAPGSSMAMGIKPSTGNTSMNIQIQVPIYRELVE